MGLSVYRNKSNGKYWGIYSVGGNKYIFTRYSYSTPVMAIRRLFYNRNTNWVANGTRANINAWIRNTPVTKLSSNQVVNAIKSNRNLTNLLNASAVMTALRLH